MKKNLSFLLFLSLSYGSEIFYKHTISISKYDSISNEYVYRPSDTSRKVSQLIWESKANLLGYSFSLITQRKNFFTISYQKIIKDNYAYMQDYDWLDDSNPDTWSDYSWHQNTKTDDISLFNIKYSRKLDSKIKQYFSVGYKQDYKKLLAYDGEYIYSSSGIKRDKTGTLTGLVATYREKYSGIYFGYRILKNYNNFLASLSFEYSPFISGENFDNHHLRYFENHSEFENVNMYSLGFDISYNYKRYNIKLNYNYTKYSNKMGITTRTYYEGSTEEEPGTTQTYQGAGLDSKYKIISLSISKLF